MTLRQLAGPPALELEEGVDTVDDHGDEAEEGGGSERLNGVLVGYDGSVDSRGQVEEGPKGAKDELDQEPRDDVKLFADVHQVEKDENAGDPEAGHGHEDAPLAARVSPPIGSTAQDTDEEDDVEDHRS